MSARDVLAEAVWLLDREIAGAPLPPPAWTTFKENDPEVAMVYETQAGCYLSALTAAGYAVEQGWQPIETAPKDRSWIMTYQPGHGRVRAINIDYWAEEDGGWNGKPTHWRPLPAPPAGEATP